MDGDTQGLNIQDLLQQFGLGQIDPDQLQQQQQRPPQGQPANVPLPPQKPYFLNGQTGGQQQPGIDPALQAQALTGAPSIGGTQPASSNGIPLPPSGGGGPPGRDVSLDPLLTAAGQAGGMPSYGGAPPPQPGVGQPANVPLPPPRPPQAPQMQPPQQPQGIPLPPPRPPQAPQAGIQLPPNAQPTAGGPPPAGPPQLPPAGPPQMVTKAPPMSNGVPLPPSAAPYPETRPIDKTRQFMSGAGAALGNIQGPGKFASFARGAGQGITGAEKSNEEQTKDNRAAQSQHFNQMSTSFRDMMLAQQQNNMQGYRDAQAKYLIARATAIQQGGGTSNAYQNTPAGRLNMAETRIQQFDSQRRKSIDAGVTHGQITKDDAAAQYQKLEQDTEAFRQRMYQGMGINPQQAEQIKNQGTSQANPIDTKGMNEQQFHSLVPMGGWFRNPDGRVMQRTKPPPGAEGDKKPGEQQEPKKTSANEANLDDYAAMNDQGAGAT